MQGRMVGCLWVLFGATTTRCRDVHSNKRKAFIS